MAKILVIDDDPDMILALRLCLENAGHEVIEAHDGKEGLAKMKANPPDLIILDVMMRSTTEGFHLALKLRNPDPVSEYITLSKIPILMLTAIHSTTPLRFETDEDYLPVDDFVEKPIDPSDLLQKVDTLLGH